VVKSALLKKILVTLKILLSTGLLWLIFNSIDFDSTLHLLRNSSLEFFFFASVVLIFQILIATARWRKVLDHQGMHLNYKMVLRYLWIGLFFNQALPSSVGGDAFRGYYLYRKGFSARGATLGVLLDRVFGMIGLIALVVATLPLLFGRVDDHNAQWGMVIISVGALLIITVVLLLDLLPQRLSSWRIMRGLYALSSQGRRLMFTISPGGIVIALSITIHTLSVFAVVVLSQGLGLNLSWVDVLLVVPIATLFMTIPISIAGWGVREGIMVMGFGYLGVPPEQALALSILYGLLLLVVAIPGVIIWFLSGHLTSNQI
jgi:glycosyltransferase 2 family protein